MRLATFRDETSDAVRIGLLLADGSLLDLARAAALSGEEPPIELRDMLALLASGAAGLARVTALREAAPSAAILPLSSVTVLAPIPRPNKNIFCVGRNYAEHAAESLRASGREFQLPPIPNIFTKAVTSVIGPNAPIPFDPRISEQIDWEVELAVVLGRGGRHIPREDALAHVFGYTIVNDITARDLQNTPGVQWFQGKSLDGSCPTGPWIVTADELPDPQALSLRLWVNNVLKQDDTTAHMLFDVATLIASLSRILTLEPGDIISTGTPAGVGFARTPPEFLRPGDEIRAEIEGIGTLTNPVVRVEG
jgi:2-keto-4-pentenoate hydratase/2-oxohepta-3-ene-1,7-dioic acid hydratase in catechol pathway